MQSNIRMKVVKEVGEGDTCVIISKPPHKEEKEHYNTQFLFNWLDDWYDKFFFLQRWICFVFPAMLCHFLIQIFRAIILRSHIIKTYLSLGRAMKASPTLKVNFIYTLSMECVLTSKHSLEIVQDSFGKSSFLIRIFPRLLVRSRIAKSTNSWT